MVSLLSSCSVKPVTRSYSSRENRLDQIHLFRWLFHFHLRYVSDSQCSSSLLPVPGCSAIGDDKAPGFVFFRVSVALRRYFRAVAGLGLGHHRKRTARPSGQGSADFWTSSVTGGAVHLHLCPNVLRLPPASASSSCSSHSSSSGREALMASE